MRQWILIGLFFYSMAIFAAPIGTVLFTMDKVIAEQNHVQRTITRGSILNGGDIIITGPSGQAKIKYNNGTLVSINPNSHYQVSSVGADSAKQYDATLSVGSIAYSSSGKKKQGTLHTPVVALAILGTEFTVTVSPPPYTVNLDVQSGQVQVGNGVVVNGGFNAVILPNGHVNVTPDSKHNDPINNVLVVDSQLIALAATPAHVSGLAFLTITCP